MMKTELRNHMKLMMYSKLRNLKERRTKHLDELLRFKSKFDEVEDVEMIMSSQRTVKDERNSCFPKNCQRCKNLLLPKEMLKM